MVQVKLFSAVHHSMELIEGQINAFLKDNEGKIVVKDIKFNAEKFGDKHNEWMVWNAMVIYEVK